MLKHEHEGEKFKEGTFKPKISKSVSSRGGRERSSQRCLTISYEDTQDIPTINAKSRHLAIKRESSSDYSNVFEKLYSQGR